MDLFLLVAPVLVGIGVFLVFASFLVGRQLDPVQARLQQISVRPRTLEELQLRLKRAGMETTSVEFFLGVKAFVALLAAVGASALINLLTSDALLTLGGVAGGAVLGFLAP